MKVDILAIMAHPDDVELTCAGTMIAHKKMGKSIGIIDLTQGELGTNGTAQIRKEEAANAAEILGLSIRENLCLADGFFHVGEKSIKKIIQVIRKYQPSVIITNAPEDRHPDHGRGSRLVQEAIFLSGLVKIESKDDQGNSQKPWRPELTFLAIQSDYLQPDFVFDVTGFWDQKVEAIKAYKTQFSVNDKLDNAETFISTPRFMKFLDARAREFGQSIGVEYGEGFIKVRQLKVSSFDNLI